MSGGVRGGAGDDPTYSILGLGRVRVISEGYWWLRPQAPDQGSALGTRWAIIAQTRGSASQSIIEGFVEMFISPFLPPQNMGRKKRTTGIFNRALVIDTEGEPRVQGNHFPGRVQRQRLWWGMGQSPNIPRFDIHPRVRWLAGKSKNG